MSRAHPFAAARCAAVLMLGAAFAVGCVTEPAAGKPGVLAGEARRVQTPAHVREIANALIVHRSRHALLPESLDAMAALGELPADLRPRLETFAYHPGGLGVLTDGRTILFVDAEIVDGDAAWCVLSQPVSGVSSAVIEVGLVPMDRLDAAAEAASNRRPG